MEYVELLQGVWKKVREQYSLGSCVSERGLQAVLYAEMRQAFPKKKIIVEPRWSNAGKAFIPDLAVVSDGVVTDVFEIKFKPHARADVKKDIYNLIRYGTDLRECAVFIDPLSGRWTPRVSTSEDLRRHFVAVANNDAAAVWVDSVAREVPELTRHLSSFYHWFGRIGAADLPSQEWGVHVGQPAVAGHPTGEIK